MAVVCVVVAIENIDAQVASDPWHSFRPLVGVWEGVGEGFGSVSRVSHHWKFVIDGNFLRLQTRSTATTEDGSQEVHEDVGYLSFDADAGTFVFRQFLSEGYVNTYEVMPSADDEGTFEFAFRAAESAGGMRARMHLISSGSDQYEMILDLANPGEEFVACQWMRMERVSRQL